MSDLRMSDVGFGIGIGIGIGIRDMTITTKNVNHIISVKNCMLAISDIQTSDIKKFI